MPPRWRRSAEYRKTCEIKRSMAFSECLWRLRPTGVEDAEIDLVALLDLDQKGSDSLFGIEGVEVTKDRPQHQIVMAWGNVVELELSSAIRSADNIPILRFGAEVNLWRYKFPINLIGGCQIETRSINSA